MDIGPAEGERNDGGGVRRQSRRAATLAAPLHQFFATTAIACPYVPGRAERKLIVELEPQDAERFFGDLSRAGFRRSHRFAYRPACRDCAACIPVRIVVARFGHTR
ncbi:MAG TPA: hypothetical protein VFQ82_07850, partial [Stellaceae bacterium]|nr:hypothetical protein [Stellaceae bacterium]